MDCKVATSLNIVAFVLFLAGTLSPGWVVLHYEYNGGITVHVGLFYASWDGETIYASFPIFITHQVLMIFGNILCLLATIFTLLYGCGKRRLTLVPPIILNFVSGLLVLGILFDFLHRILTMDGTTDENYTYTISTPYSLVTVGIGGIVCLVTIIILIKLQLNGAPRLQRSNSSSHIQQNLISVCQNDQSSDKTNSLTPEFRFSFFRGQIVLESTDKSVLTDKYLSDKTDNLDIHRWKTERYPFQHLFYQKPDISKEHVLLTGAHTCITGMAQQYRDKIHLYSIPLSNEGLFIA